MAANTATDLITQLAIDGAIFAVFAVDGGGTARHRQRVEAHVATRLTLGGVNVSPRDVSRRVDDLLKRGELVESGGILRDLR